MTLTGSIGTVLLWLGFLGGAYAAVCQLEDPSAPWQTIPWDGYLASAVIGSLGVVLLRRDRALIRRASAESAASFESVAEALERSGERVDELAGRLDELTCEEVLELIDGRCVPVLAEFAEGRNVIAHRFGTPAYAEVMTEFASGERYLNRAWSAAADGYVDEVERSITAAQSFFRAARERLAAVASAESSSIDL